MALPTTSWSDESLPTAGEEGKFVEDGFVDPGFVEESDSIYTDESLPTTTMSAESLPTGSWTEE